MNHVPSRNSAGAAEEARLDALHRYAILDTAPEEAFDALAKVAAQVCGCPMAYVALLDATRQWVKAAHGFDAAVLTCPREVAFCNDTIRGDDLLVIEDLAASPRHAGYPTVQGPPYLRFYAGAPLITGDGHALGTLCVVDTVPHGLSPPAAEALRLLAGRVVTELELRRRLAELALAQSRLAESEAALRVTHDRLDLDFRSVLDGVTDGVLTLGADGRIITLNAAGATILGLPAEDRTGETLASLLPEEGGGDAFLDAVLAPVAHPDEPPAGRQVVSYESGDGLRRVAVTSVATRLRTGPDRGRLAMTVTFGDVTELERLAAAEAAQAAELRDQHGKLAEAYVQLERSADRARRTTRRLGSIRLAAVMAVVGVFVAAGLYAWSQGPSFNGGGAEAALPTAGSLTVTTQPISLRVAVVGVLDAGDLVSVVAPFDGLVRERAFQYGGQVERGAPLLRLDVAEVEVRMRDARTAQIRAKQRVDELRGWTTGGEVSRARRGVSAAEMEAADLRTRVGQSQMLLTRGIIPAEELRNLQQQQRSQALQLQSARQDLEATLARGDPENLRVAELELANADVRVRDLEGDLGNSAVLAPVTGVVLLPPETGTGRPQTVEVGSRVSRGTAMFTIGNLESFTVRASVDEIDVNRVRAGQTVSVTGDAFPGLTFNGRVVAVAAQASGSASSRTGMPNFAVTVAIEGLTAEERRGLAVGMSANLSIVAYEKADAIVLPPGAVRTEDGVRVVRVREGLGTRTVPVTLGITTPDGIEVRDGLRAGDAVVMWND